MLRVSACLPWPLQFQIWLKTECPCPMFSVSQVKRNFIHSWMVRNKGGHWRRMCVFTYMLNDAIANEDVAPSSCVIHKLATCCLLLQIRIDRHQIPFVNCEVNREFRCELCCCLTLFLWWWWWWRGISIRPREAASTPALNWKGWFKSFDWDSDAGRTDGLTLLQRYQPHEARPLHKLGPRARLHNCSAFASMDPLFH